MRIALVSRRFDANGGGTERDLLITARALTAAGHQVTIYADDVRLPRGDFMVRRVIALPLGRALRLLSFALRAAPLARREGAELVVSFARAMNADVMRSGGGAHASYVRAARRWQTPLASRVMRLSPYHRTQIVLERAAFRSRRIRCAIAVSEIVRLDLMNTLALSSSKTFTLYNGVDLKRFAPNRDKSLARKLRAELGIGKDSSAVAFIGNGFARKGLGFLLEAWSMLEARPYLIVAGADRAAAAYRRRAIQKGIGDRVFFVGPVSDIARLLAAVDAVALPSLFEPFGNVILEAMAAGLPALCSRQTGAAELIPPQLRELIVTDPTNVEELATRLKLLLKLRGGASQLARATAEQYTWERHTKKLLGLISAA